MKADTMMMISTGGIHAPVAIVSNDQKQQHSVRTVISAPEHEGLRQALANIDPATWQKLQTLLRAHAAGLTFTLLDKVDKRRVVDNIRLERAARAFKAARRAPNA